MPSTADQTLHDVLATLVTFGLVAYALLLLVKHLARSRPDLRIGLPVGSALVIRVLAAGSVSLLPIAATLRGGDEIGVNFIAHQVAASPLGAADWAQAFTSELHIFVLALPIWAYDAPDLALRTIQAGLAVAGLVLLATAVYELAGRRAAVIAAWLLALEPTSIFFTTIIHRESAMMLASGLVAFGGAVLWKRADLRALVPMLIGCLIAIAIRPYAGWFLIAAAAAISLHAGIRSRHTASVRSLTLVAAVVLAGAITAPTVLRASTSESLDYLQKSQGANVADTASNLNLEQVDFSTRGAIITNLPIRIRDVLLKPYPWQLGNASQQFGLLGTTVFYTLLVFLVSVLWRNRGSVMERAGPLIYVGGFLLIAYALSAGNAGTAFRYRTHVVAVVLCVVAALWVTRTQTVSARSARARAVPNRGLLPAP